MDCGDRRVYPPWRAALARFRQEEEVDPISQTAADGGALHMRLPRSVATPQWPGRPTPAQKKAWSRVEGQGGFAHPCGVRPGIIGDLTDYDAPDR